MSNTKQRKPLAARASKPVEKIAAKTGTSKLPSKAARSKSAPTLAFTVRETSKLGTLIALLRRKEGATIEHMMKATGWQAHSVRGALSGALKKKRGLAVASAVNRDGVRVYRVAG